MFQRYERSPIPFFACCIILVSLMQPAFCYSYSKEKHDPASTKAIDTKVLDNLAFPYFIENVGQIDSKEILFYSKDIYFTQDGMILCSKKTIPITKDVKAQDKEIIDIKYREIGSNIKYSFQNSNSICPIGADRYSWDTNIFKDSNAENAFVNIPNYKRIIYKNIWDGIDIVYEINNGKLKYNIILHPYADPIWFKGILFG